MAISAANLKAFNAANVPQADNLTAGGGIDTSSPLAAFTNDPGGFGIAAHTGSALDTTQTVTVKARGNTKGALITEAKVLTGAADVSYTNINADGAMRILSVVISAITDQNLTLKDNAGATIFNTFVSTGTELKWSRVFPNAYSDAVATTVRYDKTFWQNADPLTGLGPTFRLTADPAAIIKQGIHTSKNDSTTIANRLAVPGGITFVDDNIDQTSSDLVQNDNQGVWWEQTAAAGAGPLSNANSQFTSQLTVASI